MNLQVDVVTFLKCSCLQVTVALELGIQIFQRSPPPLASCIPACGSVFTDIINSPSTKWEKKSQEWWLLPIIPAFWGTKGGTLPEV